MVTVESHIRFCTALLPFAVFQRVLHPAGIKLTGKHGHCPLCHASVKQRPDPPGFEIINLQPQILTGQQATDGFNQQVCTDLIPDGASCLALCSLRVL